MVNLKAPLRQLPIPRLLALPPELRTTIYELALASSGLKPFIDTSGILEPALLRVNKQIRSETTRIFYQTNDFEVIITDLDSSTLVKLYRKTLSLKVQGIQNFSIKFCFVGHSRWHNLCKWVELYFRNPVLLYILPPSKTVMRQRTSMGDIIGTMFATANVMRKAGLKWSDVEAILPEYREMLKNGDERWG